jgi:hypothetical protein
MLAGLAFEARRGSRVAYGSPPLPSSLTYMRSGEVQLVEFGVVGKSRHPARAVERSGSSTVQCRRSIVLQEGSIRSGSVEAATRERSGKAGRKGRRTGGEDTPLRLFGRRSFERVV